MGSYRWQLSRVDCQWSMTRVTTGGIAIRNLNFIEKVWYFMRMRRHDILYPNWKKG